jgi:4-hydroxybenzoate polyprenyltransferase
MDNVATQPNSEVSIPFSIGAYVRLVRPKQWVKNLFVFAPLIFARELFFVEPLVIAVKGFFAFCCVASAVYVINDIADIEADRAHPEKKFRPLAAGSVSLVGAYVFAGVVLACAALIAVGMDARFLIVLSLYFLMNLAYSFGLKNIVLLDVFIIAAGFMMRVVGGAYAINVETSSWLVLCTLFISLFLGFAKRRTELIQVPDVAFAERKVLRRYQVSFLDNMLTIAAAGTVISYALYTVAPRTLQVFGTDKLIYTTVFVIYGVFRYLYLIHTSGATDKPADVVTSDVPILATTSLWVVSCVLLIYAL